MDNIILIGMPGCGKTTVGELLAKLMGYDFIDTDLIIQHAEGKKLFEILRDSGSEYFSRLENSVNKNLQAKRTVIATGGSVVYEKEAMEHLKSIGKVVYLEVSLGQLEKRIKNFATRGIRIEEGQTFRDLYLERLPLYKRYADITVNCSRGSLQKNAEKIFDRLIKEGLISANL